MKMLLAFFTTFLISVSLFASTCATALEGLSIEQVAELETFGPKGFKSPLPLPSTEVSKMATEMELVWWDQRIYFVSSKEEAIKHHNKFTDTWANETVENPLMFAAYVIVDVSTNKDFHNSLKNSEKLARQAAALEKKFHVLRRKQKTEGIDTLTLTRVFDDLNYFKSQLEDSRTTEKELIRNTYGSSSELSTNTVIIKNYETQEWVNIPQSFLDRIVSPKVDFDKAASGNFLRQPGWTKPNQVGVVIFEDMEKSTDPNKTKKSKRIAKIRNFSQQMKKNGFYLTTNQDMRSVIEGCRDQKRKGQTVGEGRYNETFIQSYVDLASEGKAHSVEVRDSSGKVVAGLYGKSHPNGMIDIESVFYPTEITDSATGTTKEINNGIDYAKVATLHLINIAKDAGFTFMNLGMVTPFTRSGFKGEYVSRTAYQEMLTTINPNPELNFDLEW